MADFINLNDVAMVPTKQAVLDLVDQVVLTGVSAGTASGTLVFTTWNPSTKKRGTVRVTVPT